MSKGISFPINKTSELALATIVGAFFLAIVISVIAAQSTSSMCAGMFRPIAATIADMTGANVCPT